MSKSEATTHLKTDSPRLRAGSAALALTFPSMAIAQTLDHAGPLYDRAVQALAAAGLAVIFYLVWKVMKPPMPEHESLIREATPSNAVNKTIIPHERIETNADRTFQRHSSLGITPNGGQA